MALIIVYSRSGVTEKVANIIKEVKGGDIFKIITPTDYSGKMGFMKGCYHQVVGTEPEINEVPNIDNYNVIYVGGPTWAYRPCAPLKTLLSKLDFQNKTVIPFLTCGGSYGDYFKSFKEKAKNANVVHEGAFVGAESISDEELKKQVSDWLQTIE